MTPSVLERAGASSTLDAGLVHERALGDLQRAACAGSTPVLGDDLARPRSTRSRAGRPGAAERLTETRSGRASGPRGAPLGGLPAGLAEHPARRAATIRPVSSATGMNSPGASRPRSGCCQRTSASTPTIAAGREVDDRLVVQPQLVVLERAAQLVLGAQPARSRGRASARRRARSGRGRAPWRGTSRRRRRGAGPRRRWLARRRRRAMPIAGGHEVLAPADARTAAARARSDALGDRDRLVRRRRARRTRITNSSPPKRATVSPVRSALVEARGERAEQLVAGVVAERVVDQLEVVEVEEQDADRRARARRALRERVVEPVGRTACGWAGPVSGSCRARWRMRSLGPRRARSRRRARWRSPAGSRAPRA